MKRSFICSVIALAFSSGAFSQSHSIENTDSVIFHATKQEALEAAGLDVYATEKNIAIMDQIAEDGIRLKKDFSQFYGGSWIEYDENNTATQVIATTNKNFIANNLKLNPGYKVKYVDVKFTLAELDLISEKAMSVFSGLNGKGDEPMVFSAAVDEPNNVVIVRGRVAFLSEIESIIRFSGLNMEAIRIEAQDGPVNLYGTLYGGTKIYTKPSTSSAKSPCTSGFNVVIDEIYPGAITASHCYIRNSNANNVYFNLGSTANIIDGPYIGEFFAIGWPDNMDAAIFGNVNFVHTLPHQILGASGIPQGVKPLGVAAINSPICTYGGTSGWRCGPIKTLTTRVNMGGGKIMVMAEADVCGAPGDSGGPVVTSGSNALGILTGGLGGGANGTCGPVFGGGSRPNAIFQQLAPYLAKYSNVKISTQ